MDDPPFLGMLTELFRTRGQLLTCIHSDECQLRDETDLQLGETKLPQLGEVYWTETWIFGGSDPKPERPCVVMREPTSTTDLVVVITRTSDTDVRGVQHPKDPSLGLNKPGAFSLRHLRSAEARLFLAAGQLRGSLPEPYLTQVKELYEKG